MYRYDPYLDDEGPQQAVISQQRARILYEYHDSETSTTMKWTKLCRKFPNFFFTGMRKYVAKHIQNYVEYQTYKPANVKLAGLLQTPVASKHFETTAIDLFGPLPRMNLGHSPVDIYCGKCDFEIGKIISFGISYRTFERS